MVRRQFLTPPTLPLDTVERCLAIPNSKEWLGIFNSVLLETAQAFNYEQVNASDMSPDDVAAICFQIYVDYLQGACGVDCADVAACLYPVGRLQRMNPTTGRYEVSDNGGATWEDASAQDPRFSAPRNEQLAAFDCDDAKAIVGLIQAMIDDLKAEIDLGYSVLGIVAAIVSVLAIIFSFGAVAPVAIAFAGALTGITSAAITAALTSAVWERLLCNISCIIGTETEITEAMFDDIMAQLALDETGLAYTVLWHAINQLGPVGLHNAVALQTAATGLPADCSGCACAWCYTFDFTSSDGGWAQLFGYGVYSAGVGWEDTYSGQYRAVNIRRTFTTTAIDRIVIEYDTVLGSIEGTPADARNIAVYEDAGLTLLNRTVNPNGSGLTLEWTGLISTDTLSILATCGFDGVLPYTDKGGSYTLRRVTVYGPAGSTNPFGADNC